MKKLRLQEESKEMDLKATAPTRGRKGTQWVRGSKELRTEGTIMPIYCALLHNTGQRVPFNDFFISYNNVLGGDL